MAIRFYRVGDEHGDNSNFAPFRTRLRVNPRLVLEGPTSEHVFQALKFIKTDPTWGFAILKCDTPHSAANCGRSRRHPIDPKWDDKSVDFMRLVVLMKTLQNPDFAEDLRATGNERLIEHTRKDKYWADGGDGKGKNWLGRILMEVRKILDDPDAVRKYEIDCRKRLGMWIPEDL